MQNKIKPAVPNDSKTMLIIWYMLKFPELEKANSAVVTFSSFRHAIFHRSSTWQAKGAPRYIDSFWASDVSYLSFIQQHIRYNMRQASRKNQHNVLVGIGKLANLQHKNGRDTLENSTNREHRRWSTGTFVRQWNGKFLVTRDSLHYVRVFISGTSFIFWWS